METLILAFTLFHKSNACYTELQNTLCLPSKRMLRDISSNLSVNAGAQCEIYLEKKATLLKQHEKLVNLQLDEIHIKPKISYQAGQFVGSADNQKELDSIPTLAQYWFNVVHYNGPWPAYNLGPV